MNSFLKNYFKITSLCYFLLLILSGCTNLPSSPKSAHVQLKTPMLDIKAHTNQKITLLLPLQGRYAGPAQAIRNGFLAAHDLDKKQRHVDSQVSIIDISKGNVTDFYQNAVNQGADVIVGPLTKEEVKQIAQLPEISTPTLALNTLEAGASTNPRFYQFGLSPLDEYQAMAQKAYASGYRNAIILTPNTPWGKTAANTLHQQWQKQGGSVTDQLAFSSSMQQLSTDIPHFMKVTPGASRNQRGTYRQDFDVILLAAPTPNNAKEILSLLKYNYIQNIPIYASSTIYAGIPNPDQDQELNGIYFCDIPWITNASAEPLSTIYHHSATLWPQNFRQYPRFYALGVDAYRLASKTPGFQNGATGHLTIDRRNQIHRQLLWFQIKEGIPVPISTPGY